MLHLEPITPENASAITALQVLPAQRAFVAPNRRSLEEAEACNRAGGFALPLGIYDGDTPVGFLIIGFGVDDDAVNLHRPPPKTGRTPLLPVFVCISIAQVIQ